MSLVAVYAQNQLESSEEFVKNYLPLVKKIALHLIARLPDSIELDDLLQVGLIGLLQSRESYDPSQGASFATYAGIRIKGAMLDEVRRSDWAPRSVQQNMRAVAHAISAAENRLGRSAGDADIARELGVSLAEYQKIACDLVSARLGALDEDEGSDPADEQNPFAQLERDGLGAAVQEAIMQLPEKEKLMMSLYYGEELNLKEIGEVLGISESRVSQIHGQALARIRARLSDWQG